MGTKVDVLTEIKIETLDSYLKTIEQTLLEIDGYVDFSCREEHVRQHVNTKKEKLLKITENFRQSILYKGEKLPLTFDDTELTPYIESIFKEETKIP